MEMNAGANPKLRYVIVTAAYNERQYIERVIQSVIQQSLPPVRWVIVSDGSTDETDAIVADYAARHPFIQLCRITEEHPRNFAAQVLAIQKGIEQLQGLLYDFVGNLDADVSFGPDYFERLLQKFVGDPHLGLAGGCICEPARGGFAPRSTNQPNSVAHAVQLFRRECFEGIGGYVALPYGGPDWHAEVRCRMSGWRAQTFSDIEVHHHRPTGGADGQLRGWYRQGLMDFSLGSHPVFEAAKLARRLRSRPYVLGALARLSGFLWAWCRGHKPAVSKDFVAYLRREQIGRLWRAVGLEK
jgi:glycosyltransferase involved in cell wall biosynthesis